MTAAEAALKGRAAEPQPHEDIGQLLEFNKQALERKKAALVAFREATARRDAAYKAWQDIDRVIDRAERRARQAG